MKTDIIIRTANGCVRYAPTGNETFSLVGHPDAIDALREILPVLETDDDNQIGIAGDGLVHLLYLAANDTEAARPPRLVSHKEMQDRTLLEAPIVLFQRAIPRADGHCADGGAGDEEEDSIHWETDRVFIDDDDAERFVAQQRHRYPEATKGIDWRTYAVPMTGRLVNVVKHARDLTNA